MINPKVSIALDKDRSLLLNLNAMVAFEEATGINMLRGFDASQMSMKEFRAFLWASLIHEDPELKLEDVGNMIHSGNMGEITNSLINAWNAAVPQGDGEGDPLSRTG